MSIRSTGGKLALDVLIFTSACAPIHAAQNANQNGSLPSFSPAPLARWAGVLQEAVLVQPQNRFLPNLSSLRIDGPAQLRDAEPLPSLDPTKAAILLKRAVDSNVNGDLSRAASSRREERLASLRQEEKVLADAQHERLVMSEGRFRLPRGSPITENYFRKETVSNKLLGVSTRGQRSALSMLTQANWLLQDISASRLAQMSLEELNGLAAVLMEPYPEEGRIRPHHLQPYVQPVMPTDAAELADFLKAGSPPLADHLKGLTLIAQARVEQNLAARSLLHGKESLGPLCYGAPKRYFSTGAPLSLKLYHRSDPDALPEDMHPTVFRHYTKHHLLSTISGAGKLMQGQAPYVSYGNRIHRVLMSRLGTPLVNHIYRSLTGVFLTTPGVDPESVGVEDGPHGGALGFVDLLVPRRLPVLRAEKNIFLIPLPPLRMSDGYEYFALKYGAAAAKKILARFPEMHPPTPINVPVRVISQGVTPSRSINF